MTEMVSHLTLFTITYSDSQKAQQVLASSIEAAMKVFHEKYPDEHINGVLVGDQMVHYGESHEVITSEST